MGSKPACDWILSCEEAVQIAYIYIYRMFVVLIGRCPLVSRIKQEGEPTVTAGKVTIRPLQCDIKT